MKEKKEFITTSSAQIIEFVSACPEYDGRLYYTCIQNCMKNNKYMKDICRKAKKEYFDELERITTGKTR